MGEPKRYPIPHLRAWRLHRLMTHAQLAQAAGVGRNTVLRLERPGARANELTIYKLAQALGLSPQHLRQDPPTQHQPPP